MRSVIASAYPREGATTVGEFGRTLLSCGPDDEGRSGATVVAPASSSASGHGGAGPKVPAAAWHAQRRWVAACDPDGVTVRVYSAEGRPLEARARALAAARVRGGDAAGAPRGLAPFEPPLEPLATLVSPHHRGPPGVAALCWSPAGGAALAVGCAGGVCLWRLSGLGQAKCTSRCTWLPHPGGGFRDDQACVAALAFSPDGRELASVSGGLDDLVVVWDVASGTGTRLRRSGATWPLGGVVALQLLLFAPRAGLLAGRLGLAAYVLLILLLELAHALHPRQAGVLPYAPARRLWAAFKEGADAGGSAAFVAAAPFRAADRDRPPGGGDASGTAVAAYSPCGHYLVTATGADRGHFRVWDTTSWTSRRWEVPKGGKDDGVAGCGSLTAACWGPEGASLALAFSSVPGLCYMHFTAAPPSLEMMVMQARSDGTLGLVDAAGRMTPSPCRLAAWDPDAGRLALAFCAGDGHADEEGSGADLVALFETSSTSLLDLRLVGHIRGPPGSGAPVGLAFHPRRQKHHAKGAELGLLALPGPGADPSSALLLGISWSSGHVSLLPLYL